MEARLSCYFSIGNVRTVCPWLPAFLPTSSLVCRLARQLCPVFTDFVLFLCACAPRHSEQFDNALGLLAERWEGELTAYRADAT